MNESNLSEIVDDGLDTMQTPPLDETKWEVGSGTDEGKTKGKGGSKDLGSSINKVVGNLDGEVEQGSLKNKVVVEKRNKEGLQVTRGVCRHTCLRGGSCRCKLDLSGKHSCSLVLCLFCRHCPHALPIALALSYNWNNCHLAVTKKWSNDQLKWSHSH